MPIVYPMWKTVKRLLFHGTSSDTGKPPSSGQWGEAQAERTLRQKGYAILGRRVRIGRRDELDLVARDGNVLVFVEVKTRKTEVFGRPNDSVNHAKRHYLSRAAVRYLKHLRQRPEAFRFDVVEVIGTVDTPSPLIRHIENAFSLDRCYRVP
ncbi:MAG: YraN family protein [Kiritimatiellae bacterium]|nr:YraN family protein [Kiritimatiellia bacterium]